MFRRAVLEVSTGAAREHEILRRYFAQTLTADGRGHLMGEVDDTRVPPPGAGPAPRFSFELDDPHATEVSWSLDLFRMAPSEARGRGLDEAAIRVPVLSGRTAVAASRAARAPRRPRRAAPRRPAARVRPRRRCIPSTASATAAAQASGASTSGAAQASGASATSGTRAPAANCESATVVALHAEPTVALAHRSARSVVEFSDQMKQITTQLATIATGEPRDARSIERLGDGLRGRNRL
jgi:hypothetical protein